MIGLKKTSEDLPGWFFEVDEISAGVYKVRGVDEAGRSVEATGTDPDILLEDCKKSAAKMRDAVPSQGRTT
jgi:hypothetical protein